jgi:hypothetical protein
MIRQAELHNDDSTRVSDLVFILDRVLYQSVGSKHKLLSKVVVIFLSIN